MIPRRDLRLNISKPDQKIDLAVDTGASAASDFRMLNISRSGFLMQGDAHLKVGKELEASLILPSLDLPIKVIGQVSWSKPFDAKNQGFGVFVKEFVGDAQDVWQQCYADIFSHHQITELNHTRFKTITSGATVESALQLFQPLQEKYLLVVDSNQTPLGYLTAQELLSLALNKSMHTKKLSDLPLRKLDILSSSKNTLEILQTIEPQNEKAFAVRGINGANILVDMEALLPFWLEYMRLEKDQLERRFLNGLGWAAHEIKSPLTIIDAANHMLLTQTVDMETYVNNALPEMIRENCKHMNRLIDDLLMLAKPTQINIETPQSTSLLKVCEQILESFQILAEQKQQTLHFENQTQGKADVVVEERKIRQILYNLVSNAIKYSPLHSKIKVYLEGSSEGFRIGVVDQGPGIKPEHMPHVFHEFARLPNLPTANEKSTGMGLAIAQNLAKSMGTKIEAQSTPGKGSEFSIRLRRTAA